MFDGHQKQFDTGRRQDCFPSDKGGKVGCFAGADMYGTLEDFSRWSK